MVDPETLRRAQEGDLDAFDAVVRALQGPLLRVCGRILGSAEDAEEVVQDALVRLHAVLARVDPARDVYLYARRIAVNEALDALARRRSRQADAMPEGLEPRSSAAGPERQAMSGEIRDQVLQALERLTPRERTAFVLRSLEEESFARIAEAMDIEEVSARRLFSLARQRLMGLLADLARPAPPGGTGREGN